MKRSACFFLAAAQKPGYALIMTAPKDWSVYMLRCRDGSLYTGSSNDLEKRLANHNSGKGAKYTAARRPVELVFVQKSLSKTEALSREYQIKQLARREKLALLQNPKQKISI